MQESSIVSVSPSYNSHSSGHLAEIAARVIAEFNHENELESSPRDPDEEEEVVADINTNLHTQQQIEEYNDQRQDEEHNDDDEDFEFSFMCREPDSPSVSADEIFSDGKIKPLYQIANTNLSIHNRSEQTSNTLPASPIRLPLSKLLAEDRETPSCSSSDGDELDGVPPGTYCVWRPETAPSPARCKKSNSTGTSSKRWNKLKDLIYRSNSDGRDSFVFLSPATGKKKEKNREKKTELKDEGEKRKSYLPYRQEIVGLFHTVNGLNRNLRHF